MKNKLNLPLVNFLSSFSTPVYLVGGFVRNFLIDKSAGDNAYSTDIDLAAPISDEDFLYALNEAGGEEVGHYKRTHTVVFKLGGQKCEFTSFRKEVYAKGGCHTPESTEFTSDILEDAKRRDFKCNAVYYDVKNGEFVDPLGGIKDIENKVLDTVVSPEEVFSHDGLRLMRLARFAGELGFTPTKRVLSKAKNCADNILDISPERILSELQQILVADKKHAFSPSDAHYISLKILDETRVLDRILPELTLGRGMAQRADYHNYDVLEHSLKAVKYAHPSVRFAALFHDIGKPACMLKNGKYHGHDLAGVDIAREVFNRLRVSEKLKSETLFLIKFHMLDIKLDVREVKLRKFIVKNHRLIDELLYLKTADYKGSQDRLDESSTVIRWKKLIKVMQKDGTPFCEKDLAVTTRDLIGMGVTGREIGKAMGELMDFAVENPDKNDRESLIKIAEKRYAK